MHGPEGTGIAPGRATRPPRSCPAFERSGTGGWAAWERTPASTINALRRRRRQWSSRWFGESTRRGLENATWRERRWQRVDGRLRRRRRTADRPLSRARGRRRTRVCGHPEGKIAENTPRRGAPGTASGRLLSTPPGKVRCGRSVAGSGKSLRWGSAVGEEVVRAETDLASDLVEKKARTVAGSVNGYGGRPGVGVPEPLARAALAYLSEAELSGDRDDLAGPQRRDPAMAVRYGRCGCRRIRFRVCGPRLQGRG